MKIDLITKNQVNEIVNEKFDVENRKVWSYLDKLNQRLMKVEEDIKVRKQKVEAKEE